MNNNTNISITVRAWAEIVLQKWDTKVKQLGIHGEGNLERSFIHTVVSNANGDTHKIEFAFSLYGKFVDMGVGRGVPYGTTGSGNRRKQKVWYSQSWYADVQKLKELLQYKYALKSVRSISEALQ